MPKTGGQAITRGLTGNRGLNKNVILSVIVSKSQTAERKTKQLYYKTQPPINPSG